MHIPVKEVISHECMRESPCSVHPLFIYSKGHGSLTVLVSFISFSVFPSLSFLCRLPMILPCPSPPTNQTTTHLPVPGSHCSASTSSTYCLGISSQHNISLWRVTVNSFMHKAALH